jgi:hypothetical protein
MPAPRRLRHGTFLSYPTILILLHSTCTYRQFCSRLHDIVALILHGNLSLQLWLSPPPTLLYLFLDIRFPARKDGRFLCLSTSSVSKQTPKTSHGCMRCELHADLPCICTSRKVAHTKKRSNNQSSTQGRSSPDCDNPKTSNNAFFTPSPVWGSPRRPIKEILKAPSPNAGHCYAISSTHESRQPFASSIGEFWATCPSPIRTVVAPSYVQYVSAYAYYYGDCHKRACIHACACR